MEKVCAHIKLTVDELFVYNNSEPNQAGEVRKAFAGESRDSMFRVPAADTGREIFFNNEELLKRFTSLCRPEQEGFLRAVRAILEKEGVDVISLLVDWTYAGSIETRLISIRKINADGCLNMYL